MSRITVCVPVYNGMPHLEQTLDAVCDQTFGDIRILVSVDPSSDGSLAYCRGRQRQDERISIVAQHGRLHFVGNVDFLIRRVNTEFFCILPQDDVPQPDYLDKLMDTMAGDPGIALAWTDMDRGPGTLPEFQGSLRGTAIERRILYLAGQMNHVEWRGLIRTAHLERLDGVPAGAIIDHYVPHALALSGDLVRVPGVRYHKRIHAASATARQLRAAGSRVETIRHSIRSSLDCYEIARGKAGCQERSWLEMIALMLRLQLLMEKLWPLYDLKSITGEEYSSFRSLHERRTSDLLFIGETLARLSPQVATRSRVVTGLRAMACFHLALLAEHTGNASQATCLAGIAAGLDPELADRDGFRRSAMLRLVDPAGG